MTTANKITILRILLIPFFVVETLYYIKTGSEVHWLAAILAFAVTAILDGVDGYIARRYNQKSELGAILDPLADKLLLVSAIVMLSFDNQPYFKQLPLWLAVTVIGRDVLLAIGSMVVWLVVGKMQVRPRMIGKAATVLQMLTVAWVLLRWDYDRGLKLFFLATGILTGVSGLFYVWDWTRQLSSHPASSPAGKSNSQ